MYSKDASLPYRAWAPGTCPPWRPCRGRTAPSSTRSTRRCFCVPTQSHMLPDKPSSHRRAQTSRSVLIVTFIVTRMKNTRFRKQGTCSYVYFFCSSDGSVLGIRFFFSFFVVVDSLSLRFSALFPSSHCHLYLPPALILLLMSLPLWSWPYGATQHTNNTTASVAQ